MFYKDGACVNGMYCNWRTEDPSGETGEDFMSVKVSASGPFYGWRDHPGVHRYICEYVTEAEIELQEPTETSDRVCGRPSLD